jgi:hypothetical protein
MQSLDRNFYVDESIRFLNLHNSQKRKITLIGAGIGIKNENVELIDWCGIAFYQPNGNNKNGNGYWTILGKECFDLIFLRAREYRPEKIYVCNQIAFYIMKAIISYKKSSRQLCSIVKSMKPVIHKEYRRYNNEIYKTKQKVGNLVKKKLKVSLSKEEIIKILEGKLYDIKRKEIINLKL